MLSASCCNISNPKLVKIATALSDAYCLPLNFFKYANVIETFTFSAGLGYTSTTWLHVPPAISWIIAAAFSSTFTVFAMSTPFSKRVAASVLNPWCTDVLRIWTFSNQALSKKILLVDALTPLCKPPKTPAIHIGFSISQIIKSSAVNFLSFSSNEVNKLLGAHFFTTTFFPWIFAASKACNGWPVSCKMKLVMSTILLIDLAPIDCNLFFNHVGDGPTFTPSIKIPLYLPHASGFSITTS